MSVCFCALIPSTHMPSHRHKQCEVRCTADATAGPLCVCDSRSTLSRSGEFRDACPASSCTDLVMAQCTLLPPCSPRSCCLCSSPAALSCCLFCSCRTAAGTPWAVHTQLNRSNLTACYRSSMSRTLGSREHTRGGRDERATQHKTRPKQHVIAALVIIFCLQKMCQAMQRCDGAHFCCT